MNSAEIMTLLSNDVKESQIRIAIMAGKISGILRSADITIGRAKAFKDGANWTEILRLLEGTLDDQIDHQAQDGEGHSKRRTQRDRDEGR